MCVCASKTELQPNPRNERTQKRQDYIRHAEPTWPIAVQASRVKEPQSGCLTHWKTDKPKRIQLIESMHQIEQEEPPKKKKKKKGGRRKSGSVLSGNQMEKPVPRNHPGPRNHPEPVSPRQKRRNRCTAGEGVYHAIAQGDPSKSGDS